MLETIDTKKMIEKEAYKHWFPRLKTDLRELQQKAREAGLPAIVLLEGWHMSGKADALKHLGEALDPRGFSVHTTFQPSEDERERHWLRRFWVRMPGKGKIALFDRSWYNRTLDDRVEKRVSREEWMHAYTEINQTEEMLTRDGALILKYFLHISKKEQRRRLKAAEKDPFRRFEVTKEDWEIHEQYDEYEQAVEEMLERTSNHFAPWIIVESGEARYRRMKIFQTMCEGIVNGINTLERKKLSEPVISDKVSLPVLEEMPTILDKVDLKKNLSAEAYEEAKVQLQLRLRRLQAEAIQQGVTMVAVYEGWDASGKGGSIRRLTATMDPRYYDVISIGKPTPEDLSHHYLWRFWRQMPRWGHLTIFDRSWYGRVLVERIEKLCSEAEWRRAYQEINEFELQLYRSGIMIVKFWLHISPEEQLNRFNARSNDPHKIHKLTDEDWRNRDKWSAYLESVEDMINKTSTTYAPWTIIEGDCKRYARVKAMETVCKVFEKGIAQKQQSTPEKKIKKAK